MTHYKEFKSVTTKKDQRRKPTRDKITLHPLDFETALRAAMQTGAPPLDKQQVGKGKKKGS